MQKQDWFAFSAVLVGCAAVTSVMFVYFKTITGSLVPPILPEIQTDARYYLILIREVLDGHPLLGNPYTIEHMHGVYPGLILPIWLAAIPGLLGLSMNALYIADAYLYSLLLGALLFALCNKLNGKQIWISAAIAIFGVASLHNYMIRPAIMQTIFPAFALVALSLNSVLNAPNAKRNYIYLGASSALSFYLYPYLWMITFTSIGLLGVAALLRRDWRVMRNLIVMCFGVFIICIPQILLTVFLLEDTIGQQLHMRIGLVETHRVHPNAVLFAKYTILMVLSLLALMRIRGLRTAEKLILLLAGSLLIATLNNVITGKEMHYDTHFWRIGMFVTIIAIPVFLDAMRGKALERVIAGLCVAALMLTTINRVAIRGGGFAYLKRPESVHERQRDEQFFNAIFIYFNDNNITNAVILATPRISGLIPLYTKNYVFFHGQSRAHNISDAEVHDRFLIQHIDQIDTDFIADPENIITFWGWHADRETALRRAYGEDVKEIDILGGETFVNATMERVREINAHYDSSINQYQLDYIVIDAESTENPRLPSGSTIAWKNERFTIYKAPSR